MRERLLRDQEDRNGGAVRKEHKSKSTVRRKDMREIVRREDINE